MPIAHGKPRLLFVRGLVLVIALGRTIGHGGCVRAVGCLWSEVFFLMKGALDERSGRGG
jgi:hypothetical protein